MSRLHRPAAREVVSHPLAMSRITADSMADAAFICTGSLVPKARLGLSKRLYSAKPEHSGLHLLGQDGLGGGDAVENPAGADIGSPQIDGHLIDRYSPLAPMPKYLAPAPPVRTLLS